MNNEYLGTMRDGNDCFPVGSNDCPLILVWNEKGKIETKFFNSNSKIAITAFLEALEELKGKNFKILGAWPGKWKTDVFEMSENYVRTELLIRI